jgi:hypothetical protein
MPCNHASQAYESLLAAREQKNPTQKRIRGLDAGGGGGGGVETQLLIPVIPAEPNQTRSTVATHQAHDLNLIYVNHRKRNAARTSLACCWEERWLVWAVVGGVGGEGVRRDQGQQQQQQGWLLGGGWGSNNKPFPCLN